MTQTSPHTHTQGTHKHTQGTHGHRERTHIEVPLGAHPGWMAWQKFSPTPTPNTHTLITRTSMSPIIPLLQMFFFFPENLTGPLSRALLTQEGQEWRVPGECRQDIMAEGRAGVLLSALGELQLSPVQGPWGATQGSPLLLMILHFSSGCDPRFALELHSLETSWGSFMDSFIQKMPDPRLGEDRDSWTHF